MNNKVLASLAVVLCLQLSAGRNVYIINDTSEMLNIKGPTKSTNKVVIQTELKPGGLVVKDVDADGNKPTDMLDLTIAATPSKALKKYQAKYAKPMTTIVITQGDDLELSVADTFTKARISNATTF